MPGRVDARSFVRGLSAPGGLVKSFYSPRQANLSSTVPDILTRSEIDTDCWKETLQRLLGPNKKIGSYFGSRHRLNEVATQRGCKYIKNNSRRDVPLQTPSTSTHP